MPFSNLKALTIPEGEAVKITIGGTVVWEKIVAPSYKNWVRYSTESDGTTIYNGGLGYKDGWRVRSGGTEAEQRWTSITGFIPFQKGDVVYIYPPFIGGNTYNTINFYDESFAHLGQVTASGVVYGICSGKKDVYSALTADGVTKLTFTDNFDNSIAYIRVGNLIYADTSDGHKAIIKSGSEMIITKNEEIPL